MRGLIISANHLQNERNWPSWHFFAIKFKLIKVKFQSRLCQQSYTHDCLIESPASTAVFAVSFRFFCVTKSSFCQPIEKPILQLHITFIFLIALKCPTSATSAIIRNWIFSLNGYGIVVLGTKFLSLKLLLDWNISTNSSPTFTLTSNLSAKTLKGLQHCFNAGNNFF